MKPCNPKTVLYVHANNSDIGGADYCLFKLASQLDETLFRPVVCLARETPVLELYKAAGITTHVIDMERIKKNLNPFYLMTLAAKFFPTVNRIRTIIRKENVDVVHGNDLLDIYGPVAALFEGKPSTQYVRWILESPFWLKRLIAGLVYRLNHRVMTVSQGVARAMFSKDGGVLPNVVTCYDWIDMDAVGHTGSGGNLRRELGVPADALLIGCVGRLEHWKGQDVFVRSAEKVLKERPDAYFLLVGGAVEGRGRESFDRFLKTLASGLGLSGRMIFTGHRTDIRNVMEALDVFVHASRTPDPLPGVVMEAMDCGIPVIGAHAGGVPEEVADGQTGYLYEPGNPEAMARAIIRLLSVPGRSKEMGENGRTRVRTLFEKNARCRDIEAVYRSMMDRNPNTKEGETVCRLPIN